MFATSGLKMRRDNSWFDSGMACPPSTVARNADNSIAENVSSNSMMESEVIVTKTSLLLTLENDTLPATLEIAV